ncbi:MAG TPA: DNA polymerase IV [Flavobacterium sp.]|uniref:DNA polymerase IV n=1 Tax=unclassified Flavobacterium TaxID=196869 RepID=UPI000E8D7899|nr:MULTISPECIES: DNA polymerase IV [unclassified Flavobacterium]HBI01125.1 DNA polymerase IV [Flavobacterium sp.]HRE78819.1 DNA polymerase IV [Flavobacterium sp.]
MSRAIVHMDLDTFFVSCIRLESPQLNGIPLIVGGGERGVVASCSYEARYFGVRSAMPIRMAMQLCPQAKIVKGDMELFSKKSHEVTQIIEENSPLVEKASIDEFYLDITGMDKFYGCYKWTNELTQTITKETGLPISFALSVNKTVSKIATGEGKPNGNLEISESMVKPFLNPLSIRKIPMLGEVTFNLLSRLGIRNIEKLAETPAEVLQSMIGKNGLEIWKKANGIDNAPVEPYRERKSLSTEHTYLQDIIDIKKVQSLILGMVEKLAYQARAEQWLVSTVVVKIRYANFDTENVQRKIAYTSCDHVLSKIAIELFNKLYNRRMRIRLVGVSFAGLVRGTYQIDMFEDTEEMIALYQAMDKIKNRFGYDAVTRCGGRNITSKAGNIISNPRSQSIIPKSNNTD